MSVCCRANELLLEFHRHRHMSFSSTPPSCYHAVYLAKALPLYGADGTCTTSYLQAHITKLIEAEDLVVQQQLIGSKHFLEAVNVTSSLEEMEQNVKVNTLEMCETITEVIMARMIVKIAKWLQKWEIPKVYEE